VAGITPDTLNMFLLSPRMLPARSVLAPENSSKTKYVDRDLDLDLGLERCSFVKLRQRLYMYAVRTGTHRYSLLSKSVNYT